VEVKRGPQGTLEGNASIGGLDQSVFQAPPRETTLATIDAMYGSFNKIQIDAAFDNDDCGRICLRAISGSVEHQDGFVDILDFTCEMQKLGTPATRRQRLPVSSLGSFERGCKTRRRRWDQRLFDQADVALRSGQWVRGELPDQLTRRTTTMTRRSC